MRGQTYTLIIRNPHCFIEDAEQKNKHTIFNGLTMRKLNRQMEKSLKEIYDIDAELTPHMIYNMLDPKKGCNKLITFFCKVIVEYDQTPIREIPKK